MTGPARDWPLVARKELGDLLGRLGRKPLQRTLGVVALFGIVVPLRFTELAYLPAVFALVMAFLPARLVAVDALAGERERGTLEPLLASPISDRGIAVGKIVAATVYGALRSWLFLAVWLPAVVVLRVSGLAQLPLPPLWAIAVVLAGGVVVAYVASVFGVWQSAAAPSVRAILESGGALRLAIIVLVFFVAPWLLGLFSPDGASPEVTLPGTGAAMPSLATVAATNPAALVVTGLLLVTGLGVWVALLTRATIRRCERERLALVSAPEPQAPARTR